MYLNCEDPHNISAPLPMERPLAYIKEGERILKACDHMIYISYPLIKDKKLLLKITLELKKSLAFFINAALHIDHIYKRLTLKKDPKENFRLFLTRSSKRLGLDEHHRTKIIELFELSLFHKESPMTFVREEKVVIMSPRQEFKIVTLEKTKEYLLLVKEIHQKTKLQFTTGV